MRSSSAAAALAAALLPAIDAGMGHGERGSKAFALGAWALAFCALTLLALGYATGPLGWRSTVVTGSYRAAGLPLGAMALEHEVRTSDVELGDVVAVERPGFPESPVERVVRIDETAGGRRVLWTTGDHGTWSEMLSLMPGSSVGRVGFAVPFAGRALRLVGGWFGASVMLLVAFGLLSRRRDARARRSRE